MRLDPKTQLLYSGRRFFLNGEALPWQRQQARSRALKVLADRRWAHGAALARTSLEGVWLTRIQFNDAKGELLIAGRATRAELVPRYLERLRSEEALRTSGFTRLELVRPLAAKQNGEPLRFVEFTVSSGPGTPAK